MNKIQKIDIKPYNTLKERLINILDNEKNVSCVLMNHRHKLVNIHIKEVIDFIYHQYNISTCFSAFLKEQLFIIKSTEAIFYPCCSDCELYNKNSPCGILSCDDSNYYEITPDNPPENCKYKLENIICMGK